MFNLMTYDLTQPGQNLVLSLPKGFGGDTECILVLSAPAGMDNEILMIAKSFFRSELELLPLVTMMKR